jgi:hypothetical protein
MIKLVEFCYYTITWDTRFFDVLVPELCNSVFSYLDQLVFDIILLQIVHSIWSHK